MARAPILSRALFRGSARIWLLFVTVAALLLGIGGGAWWNQYSAQRAMAHPALWRVSQGGRSAYLFGTIHAVPAGARWLSPKIAEAAARSDWLLLEVTGLDAERKDRHIFESLGRSSGLPPLESRLDPADRARFEALERKAPDALPGIDGYEDWAAALLIGSAASSNLGLSSTQAGEDQLSQLFERVHKPVLGLETIKGQLGLFDTLPATDQHALLTQSVQEAADAPRLYRALYESWAAGDLGALERQFLAPIDRSPHLRAVLIDRRNARWAHEIDHLLRHNDRVLFVAVGAGHLLGAGSVQARLTALGWRVERLQ